MFGVSQTYAIEIFNDRTFSLLYLILRKNSIAYTKGRCPDINMITSYKPKASPLHFNIYSLRNPVSSFQRMVLPHHISTTKRTHYNSIIFYSSTLTNWSLNPPRNEPVTGVMFFIFKLIHIVPAEASMVVIHSPSILIRNTEHQSPSLLEFTTTKSTYRHLQPLKQKYNHKIFRETDLRPIYFPWDGSYHPVFSKFFSYQWQKRKVGKEKGDLASLLKTIKLNCRLQSKTV